MKINDKNLSLVEMGQVSAQIHTIVGNAQLDRVMGGLSVGEQVNKFNLVLNWGHVKFIELTWDSGTTAVLYKTFLGEKRIAINDQPEHFKDMMYPFS